MENDGGLAGLLAEVVAFRDDRDWKQFHTPRNLSVALTIEAGELAETMLWKTDQEVNALLVSPSSAAAVRHEVADVLIYALLLCDAIGADPVSVVREKLVLNAAKYPADLVRGRADKYTSYTRGTQDDNA